MKKNTTRNFIAALCIFSPFFVHMIFGYFFLSSFFAGGLCVWGWGLLDKADEEERKQQKEKYQESNKKHNIALLIALLREIKKKKKC